MKDERVAARDERIPARDERIAAKDERIAAKDERIAAKDERIAAKDERIATRDERIAAKDERIAAKDERIAAKDERIAARDERVGPTDLLIHCPTDPPAHPSLRITPAGVEDAGLDGIAGFLGLVDGRSELVFLGGEGTGRNAQQYQGGESGATQDRDGRWKCGGG